MSRPPYVHPSASGAAVASSSSGPAQPTRKLLKFLIMFDNSNLLFFPGQFLSGRVIVEVDDDMPVMGE
jgi:hypothetical protein